MNPTNNQAHGLDAAIAAACRYYGLTPEQLLHGGRLKPLADARAVTMWLLREFGASYPAAGKALGGLHHTTVMWGVARVNTTPRLLEQARDIMAKVEREQNAAAVRSEASLQEPPGMMAVR